MSNLRYRAPKRQRMEPNFPFGFDLRPFFDTISLNYHMGETTRHVSNYIVSVDNHGQCQYKFPKKIWKLVSTNGLYANFENSSKKVFISGMHTKHTESLYKMAHEVRKAIKRQPDAILGNEPSLNFKQVDISRAIKQQRHKSANVLYLNAIYQNSTVVLKTTTDPGQQLRYILDAIIHSHVSDTQPNYVAKLHFVAFHGDALVVCSDQLTQQVSAFSFMSTLKQKRRPDIEAFHLVYSFCLAIRKLQRYSNFTHRDCHTSNVYYDPRRKITKFIDFDWSAIKIGNKVISVPRHLYDTTRAEYGRNKSVDCCVFFRTLGFSLKYCPVFEKKIYQPLMRRYEVDSREILKRKFAQGDVAALQLYKFSTIDGKVRGRYSHKYGIARHKESFDYIMGYYTYSSMTPDFILRFLNDHKFF